MESHSKNQQRLERKDFSKVSVNAELPNLIAVQTDSFKHFVDEGYKEAIADIFPIISSNGKLELNVVESYFAEPQFPLEKCKDHNRTFKRRLLAKLSLLEKDENGNVKSYIEDEGLLGEIPWMTEAGTFIIKGVERVIVSQLVRSPGVYFGRERDNKTGIWQYSCDMLPQRGTWLQFETDAKKTLYVKIDRNKKVVATAFFRALGITSKKEFTRLFGEGDRIVESLNKDSSWDETKSPEELMKRGIQEVYEKVKPGEPYTYDGGITTLKDKFFNDRKYDLGKAGRYKYNKKLSIYDRLLNKTIAVDLVDCDGVTVFKKGELIDKAKLQELRDMKFFENGAMKRDYSKFFNPRIEDQYYCLTEVSVYADDKKKKTITLLGNDSSCDKFALTIPDVIASFNMYLQFIDGAFRKDDIDNLSNRRIKTVGELLQNVFRAGLTKLERNITDKMSIMNTEESKSEAIKKYMQANVLNGAINDFFSTSQLSQFMDQTNPLAELANKRRLSALGPGGLTKNRTSIEVRDVQPSHYGRICPIETPEGPNIGLINNLCTYAKINEYGFIETPYRKVDKKTFEITDEIEYLPADVEYDKYIAQANIDIEIKDGKKYIASKKVIGRHFSEPAEFERELCDYVDVSPKQIVSVPSSCIPFLENDDGKRALMGANMQRQAVPLIKPESPYVGTGMEGIVAKDSGLSVLSKEDGTVSYVDCKTIRIENEEGEHEYTLSKFKRSNQSTCINQNPIVKVGDVVKKGDIIADGPSMDHGELALGQNVTVAFMTWDGYNFEDAVIMSDRMVKDDVFSSIHIEEYSIDCRDTKNGEEEITRDVQNAKESRKRYLDSDGIIAIGSHVKEGDYLVGKLTPKGHTDQTAEQKILRSIFADKTSDGKDTSLQVPHGGSGTVVDVKILSKENGDELNPGVLKTIKVYVAQKRKISEGDKMAGRHGNKGVISKIVPQEDMPYLADGTPIDILLNPIGVPSRMNIGQVLELHLGAAAKKLGFKVANPVFEGVSTDKLSELMKEANIDADGKTILYDGRTGEPFEERISVGVMYMIKLAHMVEDKLHARATGPYSLITQQPLGGKAQNGGQRCGEMEVWALEGYGAAHILQEVLTIKSDDVIGRRITYKSILEGNLIPNTGIPESFKVMLKELRGLCINAEVLDDDGNIIDLSELSTESEQEINNMSKSKQSLSFSSSFSGFTEEDEIDEETTVATFEEETVADSGYDYDDEESEG